MARKMVPITIFLLTLMNVQPDARANNYPSLLPGTRPALPQSSGSKADPTLLKHLLQKYQSELNSCVAIVNAREKAFVLSQVVGKVSNAVFRFRKPPGEEPRLQLEKAGSLNALVEGCIVRIFKNGVFKQQLRDQSLDGRIVVDFNCDLNVERNVIVMDEINVQCQATWDFYEMSVVYPEDDVTTWK